eukprot:s1818_g3.t3
MCSAFSNQALVQSVPPEQDASMEPTFFSATLPMTPSAKPFPRLGCEGPTHHGFPVSTATALERSAEAAATQSTSARVDEKQEAPISKVIQALVSTGEESAHGNLPMKPPGVLSGEAADTLKRFTFSSATLPMSPHANPFPRLGCEGPSHEKEDTEKRELQLATESCSPDNRNTLETPPMSHHAMPFPRLGCEGPTPSQDLLTPMNHGGENKLLPTAATVGALHITSRGSILGDETENDMKHWTTAGTLFPANQDGSKPDTSRDSNKPMEHEKREDEDISFTQAMLATCIAFESHHASFHRGGVPGFSSGAAGDHANKRPRLVHHPEAPVPKLSPEADESHFTGLLPSSVDSGPKTPQAMPFPRPGCEGPPLSVLGNVTSKPVDTDTAPASSFGSRLGPTEKTIHAHPYGEDHDTTMIGSGKAETCATATPPISPSAMPFPRLGCEGPSQCDPHNLHHQQTAVQMVDHAVPAQTSNLPGEPVHDMQVKIDVWVIADHGAPFEITVPWGHTAGQLLVAHAKTTGQPTSSLAINTPMATQISLTKVLVPGMIVKIDPIEVVTRLPCQRSQLDECQGYPVLTQASRESLLWQQHGWIACDEMKFYMQMVRNSYPGVFLPPRHVYAADDYAITQTVFDVIHEVLNTGTHAAFVPVLSQSHWFPIAAMPHGEKVVIWTTQEQRPKLIEALHMTVGEQKTVEIFGLHIPSTFPADCGFQTAGWIISLASLDYELKAVEVDQATHWRQLFHAHLVATRCHSVLVNSPVLVGGVNTTLEELIKLITDHGVAASRGRECADMLMSQLGFSSIQKILSSAKPWADLKARTTMCNIRIVLPEELQAMIKSRAEQGKPVGKQNSKSKQHKSPVMDFRLRAEQITVPPGVFKQQDGCELSQLAPSQVNTSSRGILLTNYEDAQPYFAIQQPLTAEGLGLLVLDHQDPRLPEHHTIVRVPAICNATSEPLIATAALFQLGRQGVSRNLPPECIQVQETPFTVVRFSLYRDQVQSAWESVTSGPVKFLLGLPSLKDLSQQDIMDVWDRQYLDMSLKRVDPSKASIFLVNIRIASHAVETALSCNGTAGCYAEQRTDDGRHPHHEYQVVWLPKRTFAEATVALQSNPNPCKLARSGNRYGLRVARQHAEQTHLAHRPEVVYLNGNDIMRFKVGPLPYGSSKASIATLFKKWCWQARPLGPIGPTRDKSGIQWHVQSTSNPENWIYQASHGDILITPDMPQQPQQPAKQAIIASANTLKTLAKKQEKQPDKPSADEDPWVHKDPWQHVPTPSRTAAISQQQLVELEEHMEKKFARHMQVDDSMGSSETSRVNDLETRVEQLANELTSFQQQHTKQQQTLQHQIAAVDTKVDKQQQSLNSLLDSKLEAQMNRIEQLFSKRPKLGRRWIQGAVIYGIAAAPDTVATKDATDKLCQIATTRLIEQSSGLRFITGDLNQPHLALNSIRHWESLGWVNAQYWALQKLGRPLQPTCKGVSIKDHLYLSPELALYLEDVTVDATFFKDHALLAAHLSDLGSPPLMPLWRQPAMIDWSQIPDLDDTAEPCHGSASDQYRQVMSQLERAVDQALLGASKPCLLARQKGRGATQEIHWVSEHSQPPKHGRHGELQPSFHGIDPTHALWLRQVRRVVNLQKLASRPSHTAQQKGHAYQLWSSILNSKGFPPCFAAWWNDTHGSIAAISEHMPTAGTLAVVAKQLEADLTHMEKVLNKTRVGQAKQSRQDDPNVIFRDIRKEPPKPCQTLLTTCRALVTEVQIIHAEADKLWLPAVPPNPLGQQVKQDKYIGHLADMFREFGQEWSRRWDRHLNVDPAFWDPMIDFVRQAFPPQPPMECPDITYDMWMAALRRKSRRAAVGPDGVSRADLLNMPRPLTEQLLTILAQVEQGGEWPQQMVQGFIVSLEKVDGASDVQQYRPVCIFSVGYRTWSSIRARQVIQHLAKLAPDCCAGSLPHISALDIWYTVLSLIEVSHHSHDELSGAVVDLVKCFNLLPRVPIMSMMHHFGVAEPILRGWASAQVSMRRRFKLRNCTGPPIASVTGFAEGCALSVTSMIAVNITAHKWLSLKFPRSTLFSYVDNLELVCPDAREAGASLTELVHFTEVLDVQIDSKKTYLWSTQNSGRRHLRDDPDAQQYTILHWARDLGGHISYTKQHTNASLTKRLEQMPSLWNLLARSLAPYPQKLRSLKAKAWPLALHGSPAAMLADNHFTTLRTGAVRGLREHSSGMSPVLHLSAVEHPSHDPQYHVLVDTVLTFRAHGPAVDTVDFVLSAHQAPYMYKQHPPGPCYVLLQRLHQLGWSWQTRGRFTDHLQLPIDILESPIQEVKQRLLEAWQSRVLGMIQQRNTFKGAPFVHPGLTTAKMQMYPPEAQALLRTALNGTFFTADRLAKRDENASSLCRFCHAEDSQLHRHWLCPHFASCRQHLTDEQIQELVSMPAVVPNHAWMPEPPSLRLFRAACLQIPDESGEFAWPTQLEPCLQLFTDGACLSPTSQLCKLASWGVVLGSVDTMEFQPVSNGLLPGWCQTAARAEVVAALSACEFSWRVQRPCFLWVDNDRVYRKLLRFKRGQCRVGINQKDADLWGKLAEVVSRLGPLLMGVGKVVSHQDIQTARDEAEEFLFKGNAAADATAASAFHRFPQLMQTWQKLCRDVSDVCTLRGHVHKVVIAVGQKSFVPVASGPTTQDVPDTTQQQSEPRIRSDQVQPFIPVPQEAAWTSRRFAMDGMQRIIDWYAQIVDPTEPVRMLSWFQLRILFEHQTGLAGVVYKPSSKKYFLSAMADRPDFVRRTNCLSRWTQGVYGSNVKVLHVRPCSTSIKFWCMCIPVRIKSVWHELSEQLLLQHQPVFAQVRELRGI